MAVSREQAETFALKALEWLASNDELLPIFLGSSGAALADVRKSADDPAFLGAVLDFVMMDDAWIISMCDVLQVSYETPKHMRAGLPGGEEVHWT